ncbi:MAG TPA: septal ring lytic transglycosylase RlpA family protein [Stellaceae bacterium]|nr:septal ring lytic transglycosylase RlpA family protein [Stellaceae bacterium]
MIFDRCLPFALPMVAALLAGCAGGKSPAPTTDASGGGNGEGIYKVGTPYNIDGTWYYPAVNYSYDQTGTASWYGEEFHGRYTANGEIFDPNTFSAAHPTLPLPSIVQVTNLENNRTLVLRVNDRGPFVAGRVIDVSRGAARALGFEEQGTTQVRVKILAPESIRAALLAQRNGGDEALADDRPLAAPRIPVVAAPLRVDFQPDRKQPPLPPPTLPPQARTVAALPGVATSPARSPQIYVQAGAFAQAANATRMRQKLDPLGPVTVAATRAKGVDLYRVRLGPFASRDDADKALHRVVGAGFGDARIVVD